MTLLPQDVLVALKLAVASEGQRYPYARLAHELGLSVSQAHMAVKRALFSGLLLEDPLRPNRAALIEFLLHGLKYSFPAERGPITRGVPTAHSAPPLDQLISDPDGMPIVWPDPDGSVRGESMAPLSKTVPLAARQDKKLYEALALVDAIRSGRARERKLAERKLRELIGGP